MALVDDLTLAHHREVGENLSVAVNLTSPRVEFDEGCLVQAVDIDLPHLLRPTLLLIVNATMPIAP